MPPSEVASALAAFQMGNQLNYQPLQDRTPLTICAKAPMEYAVEMFGKLGLRYLIIVEEETARVLGVVIKKRLVSYLEALKDV